jgi:hypothetical protein
MERHESALDGAPDARDLEPIEKLDAVAGCVLKG